MNIWQETGKVIQEPLEDLAWLAFQNAPDTCDPRHGCVHYHQIWSLARLLTRVGKPPRGLSFFAKHLAELGQEGEVVRILLAGSADCGLPTLLANAAFAARRIPSITVVDRCASPLRQISVLAERTGLDITTLQGDLSDVAHDSFDAAITHNVMLFNADATRQVIFNQLANGLRPGGRLLSTETVCDSMRPRDVDAIEKQLATIAQAVRQRALSPPEVKQVVEVARAFFTTPRRVSAYPEKDLRRDVSCVGLSLLSFETLSKGSSTSPQPRKIDEDNSLYAFVAAQKLD